MTDFNHKEASEQIARIYKPKGYHNESALVGLSIGIPNQKRLTQDLGALMELAIRNGISIVQHENMSVAHYHDIEKPIAKFYADHNNDPIEATRVAIAKALIKKGGE